jgi:hypothetical protein
MSVTCLHVEVCRSSRYLDGPTSAKLPAFFEIYLGMAGSPSSQSSLLFPMFTIPGQD